jgi:hypothetical protein
MTDPTPESLAALTNTLRLVERVRRNHDITPLEAARLIDAHVAEQCKHANGKYFAMYADSLDAENKLEALRAAADAMAEALERISGWCPATQEMSLAHTMVEEADAGLAAYRALSPATERLPKGTDEHIVIQASLDGTKSP